MLLFLQTQTFLKYAHWSVLSQDLRVPRQSQSPESILCRGGDTLSLMPCLVNSGRSLITGLHLDTPSLCWSGNVLQAGNWGNCTAYLICFLNLRGHYPLLLDVNHLENCLTEFLVVSEKRANPVSTNSSCWKQKSSTSFTWEWNNLWASVKS